MTLPIAMGKNRKHPTHQKLFIPDIKTVGLEPWDGMGGLSIYLKLSPTMKVYGRELDIARRRGVVNITVRFRDTNGEFWER
jgi:hypothetical protein